MLKRLGYLLVTAAVVAGPPMVLLRFDVRPDLDWDALPGRLSNGDVPYELVVAVLAAVAWFAWFSLVLSIVIETVAAVRSMEAPQLRLFPGTQGVAKRLVAGALMSANSLAPVMSGGLAVIPIMPDVEAMQSVEITDADRAHAGTSETAQETGRYTVQRHDTFMTIADQIGGSGDGWRDLRTENVGVRMPSGTSITNETISIEPGTRLIVPAESTLAETVSSSTDTHRALADASEVTSTVVVGPIDLGFDLITITAPDVSQTPTAPEAELDSSVDAAEEQLIGTWAVADGDNFWALSGTVLETALDRPATEDEHRAYWDAVVDANAEATLSGDADLIFTGESFDLVLPSIDGADINRLDALEQFTPTETTIPHIPGLTEADAVVPAVSSEDWALPETTVPTPEAEPAPVEETVTVVETATPEVVVVAPVVEDVADGDVVSESVADSGMKTRVGVTAIAGVAAAGVLRRLMRTRDRAHANRAPGERVDPNPDGVGNVETEQRHLSAPVLRKRLMTALQLIREECEGHGAVMLAQVSPDGEMEFAFDGHVPAPSDLDMWDAADSQDQSIWVLRGEPVYEGVNYAIPPLVGIGDGTYLSLTAAGVLGIGGGTPMQRSDHLRSMIHDLAYGPLDGELYLRLGAIGEAGEATVAGVPEFVMTEVVAELEQLMELVDESHERQGTSSMAMLCHTAEVSNSEVMVVVCAESEMRGLRDVMAKVDAKPGRYPVAFIVLGEGNSTPDVAWTATLDDEMGVMLNAAALSGALTLEPAMLGREQAEALNGALAAAVDSRPKSLGLTEQVSDATNTPASVVEATATEDHLEDLGNPATETSVAELAIEADEEDGSDNDAQSDEDSFAGPSSKDEPVEGLTDDELEDDEDGTGGVTMSIASVADELRLDFDPSEAEVSAVIAGLDIGDAPVRSGDFPTTDIEGGVMSLPMSYANRLARRQVRVELLGPVQISGTAPGVELDTYAQSLLAALVFKKRAVTFNEMMDLVWPEGITTSRARAVKRSLRNGIGAALVDGVSSGISVEVESDIEEFERLSHHARSLSGCDEIGKLQEALDLVRGTPLAGATSKAWTWADSTDRPREVLRQRVTDVASLLAGRAGEAGHWDVALGAAQRGLSVEPYSAALMTLQVEARMALGEPGIATNDVQSWEQSYENHFDTEPPTGPRKALEGSAATHSA